MPTSTHYEEKKFSIPALDSVNTVGFKGSNETGHGNFTSYSIK